jgi:hypothetical protein
VADSWTATLVADSEVLEGISLDSIADLDGGEPMPLDSEVDALDSPLGAEDVRQIFEVVTVMATSVGAISVLAGKLIDLVRKLHKPVEVKNAAGQSVITVTVQTEKPELIDKITVECRAAQ